MRELLACASSLMDTLPLCLMKFATALSSSGVMKMNFPLSSITPVSEPSAIRSCNLEMASCVRNPKWDARSSSRTTLESFTY
uniref:Uncharacterized protein n=1 Tax=Anguilla anguilla TaxID=7936 RepID=A0A0E9XNK3_ANGAN